ncbi:MAG: M10 family metallopeptidase [Xenococcaceae cyanobacterium MO_207.B15]|nr:M10 family metallopeptidase [Xenococcaceae cyanobacterium MO_207.B15]
MNNDLIKSGTGIVEQLSKDQLLSTDIEFNKFGNITDIINRNSKLSQGFGWIGNSQEEVQTSLASSGCDCPYCCGRNFPNFESVNTANNLDTDTFPLAAVASDVNNFPITQTTINTILSGSKWNLNGTKTITYSFYDDDVPNSYYGDERVSEVSEGIKSNVRQILKNIEPFVDLKFVEVEDSRNSYGQIRYQLTDMGDGYAYAYYPGNFGDISGDVHLSNNSDTNNGGGGFQSGEGSYGFETLIHETLHGLGLKHPGDYNGDGSGAPPFLADGQDNNTNTVMTYNDGGAGASTLMPYDIKALQYLYGANQNYNSGNTIYSFDEVYAFADGSQYWGTQDRATKLALWDAGGTDTLDFSGLKFDTSGYRFDLRAGGILTTQNAYNSKSYQPFGGSGQYTTSRFGTVIADEVNIENVVNSSSDDYIIANGSANTFSGYSLSNSTGNDVIVGSDDKDTLDLSDYKVSDFTTTTLGDDLIVDFAQNGSITITDYYKVSESDRLTIKTSGNDPTPPDPTTINGALIWENQNLQDESAVAPGSQFNLGNGVTATVNWQIITDGGNFVPYGGEDFVSYDSDKLGNHTGYLSLGFNNSKNDPDDRIKLSLNFNQAVTSLSFQLLDVDQSASKYFDDGVQIYADGVNVKNLLGVEIVTGDNVFADNETYMDGFEGRGSANSSSESGNISISFGSIEVSEIEIQYFSTDDAISDPGSQKIGISDLDFQIKST